MQIRKSKVLFLPSWYPTFQNPLAGIFIKKHAQAASAFADVAVLYVKMHSDQKLSRYHFQKKVENGILTVRVLCRTSPVPILKRFINRIRYLRGVRIGLKALRKNWGRPQLVHVQVAWPAGLAALLLNFISRVPYILTERWSGYTASSADFKAGGTLMRLAAKIIFRKARAVTAMSRYLADALQAHGLPQSKVIVVPNAVEVSLATRLRPESVGAVRAVSVSILHDRSKNISGLLKAFAELARSHSYVHLHLVGDGKDRAELTNLARRLGVLDKNVFFEGYVPNDELHEYFGRAHFFVLNSNYETFSMVTAEAIAHGVPVVVTKCGGPEEFVTEEVGILVERKDQKSLVDGIEFMIKNWRKYDPAKLRNYAKVKFSPEEVGRQLYEIYRNILAGVGTDV